MAVSSFPVSLASRQARGRRRVRSWVTICAASIASAGRRHDEQNHRQPRIAEQPERRRHLHDDGGGDDERRQHEAERDAVGDFLQSVDDRALRRSSRP